jgi:HJR/Mrr/RecB family endonuclease
VAKRTQDQNAFDFVAKLLRNRHGPRTIQLLKILMAVAAVGAIGGFFLAPAPWNAWIFAGCLVFVILSPFLLLLALEMWKLAAPRSHAVWKAGLTRGMKQTQRQSTRQEAREKLSKLDPFVFERVVGDVYSAYGYRTHVTRKVGDFGVDIDMRDESGRKYAVQVKRFTAGTSVGRPELQKLWAATHDRGVQVPIFVTLSHFSEPARLYAEGKGIRLVDGDAFIDMYLEVEEKVDLGRHEETP